MNSHASIPLGIVMASTNFISNSLTPGRARLSASARGDFFVCFLYGSGVCVPDGTTPAFRSLDALMRRTVQGMTGKKALLLSPPPYLFLKAKAFFGHLFCIFSCGRFSLP